MTDQDTIRTAANEAAKALAPVESMLCEYLMDHLTVICDNPDGRKLANDFNDNIIGEISRYRKELYELAAFEHIAEKKEETAP